MGRKAREVIALAVDDGGDNPHFWEILRDEAIKRAPLPQPKDETHIRLMADEEGLKFGRGKLTFGKYEGQDYATLFLLDCDYLDWLADHGMKLIRWLTWRKSKL